jgi:hypothetical protein
MVKAIIIAMPCLMLITSGIRQDFEGTLNLIQKANRIFCEGLRANFSANHDVKEISSGDMVDELTVRKYIRHYHEYSKTYDVTTMVS